MGTRVGRPGRTLGAVPPDAAIAAPLLLSAVLLLSGGSKILRPGDAERAFAALRVPHVLSTAPVLRAHPWVELTLAVGLITLPGPANVVVAVLALALFTAYLVLVWRAQARGEQAPCNCFGGIGSGRIDRWTVARNLLLVAVALLALLTVLDLADEAGTGTVIGRVLMLGEEAWWLVALVAAAAITALVVRDDQGEREEGGDAQRLVEEDYLRLPIPDVPVLVGGTGPETSLRELAAERAQLLLFLTPGCGPCLTVNAELPSYVDRLPEVDVKVVSPLTRQMVEELSLPAWHDRLVTEPHESVSRVFGLHGRPAALLLGRDGLLAGGPVRGYEAIAEFVADIEAELEPTRQASAAG